MRSFILVFLVSVLLLGCGQSWKEEPYEVIWINGTSSLGYNVGNGAYIGRVDFPMHIASNENYISVYACEDSVCSFYYIDKVKDHKYADHGEFVYGPFSKDTFSAIKDNLGLPNIEIK